jgi:hypothetical protein
MLFDFRQPRPQDVGDGYSIWKDKLSGIVEMDDYYVGSPSINGKRGRGTDKI